MDNPNEVYRFHNVELRREGSQLKGDCPFCGATAFYVNKKNRKRKGRIIEQGMFDCMACGVGGNPYTFLRMLWEASFSKTKMADYKSLAEKRGIKAPYFKKCNFAKSITTGMWIIPSFNTNKGVTNLYTYNGKNWLSTVECSQRLMGIERIKDGIPSHIVEGHWDWPAWLQIVESQQLEVNVLALPGADTFQPEFLKHFIGADLSFILDNDKAGETAKERIIEIINESDDKPSTLNLVNWNDVSLKDVNDMLRKWGEEKTFTEITSRFEQTEISEQIGRVFKPIKCESFSKLVRGFEETFDESFREEEREPEPLSKIWKQAFAVCCAVYVGTKRGGEPLWVYLKGPPSSGKSTICESLSANKQFSYSISRMKGNTLDSGWKAEGGKDVSIIPKLNGKVLVIKDFTTILSLQQQTRESIYGVMRDCYDGVYRTKTGGEETQREYWSRFGCIAGVTHKIDTENRTALGERFLKIDLSEGSMLDNICLTRNVSAMHNMDHELGGGEQDVHLDYMRRITSGFLEYLSNIVDTPTLDVSFKERIAALAEFCSFMRSQVERGPKSNLLIRPTREYGFRLSKQLYKLAVCLKIVTEWEDEDIFDTVCKVAMDTSAGFALDVTQYLLAGHEKITARELAIGCNLSEYDLLPLLNDMKELGIVRTRDLSNNGHASKVWFASKTMREVWSVINQEKQK